MLMDKEFRVIAERAFTNIKLRMFNDHSFPAEFILPQEHCGLVAAYKAGIITIDQFQALTNKELM
jgi:hypothetical protein